jgi:uncharacterized membrane protein YdjX (TVP38/TMEM64 family)
MFAPMTNFSSSPFLRRLPMVALALATGAAIWAFGDKISFQTLVDYREDLIALRNAYPLLAPMVFVLAYALMVALSVPGATIATLLGGFLFGVFPGAIYNVLGATAGALVIFTAVGFGIGGDVARRVQSGGGSAARALQGLQENQWSALLTLRLVPVVPFFLANLLPAFAGVRTWAFAVTTFFGILPGGIVFTSIGAGLSDVIARGETPDPGVIFTAPVLLPLIGLAALSAMPMILKLFQKGRANVGK